MSNYCMLDSEDNPVGLRANITPYTVLTWMAISYTNSMVYGKTNSNPYLSIFELIIIVGCTVQHYLDYNILSVSFDCFR